MRQFLDTQRELGCQWAMAARPTLGAWAIVLLLTIALLGWGR